MTEATKTNNGIWWLLLAIILEIPAMIVALIVVALVVIKSGIEDSPVTAAIVIPIAFIVGTLPVWYIFHRNFVKTYAPRRSGLYFGILMLIPLLASGGLIGAAYATKGANQKAEAAQEAQNMKVALADIRSAEDGAQAAHGGYVVDFHPKLPGEAGRLDRAARAFLATVSAANAVFDESDARLDLGYVLEPKQLAVPQGFANARSRLTQCQNDALAYGRKVNAAYAQFRAVVAGVKIDPALKRKLLADLDQRAALEKTRIDQGSELIVAGLGEAEKALIDLEHDQGSWRVIGDHFTFSDPQAQRRLTAHLSRMNLLNHQRAKAHVP